MRRAVPFARAFNYEADLLLMDEPSNLWIYT
jgi:ABC-type transporter Mla maintaining outer membrane lipid asymmetry ATPase subunit MlaF